MVKTPKPTIMSVRRLMACVLVLSALVVVVGAFMLNIIPIWFLLASLSIYIIALGMLLWLLLGKVKRTSWLYTSFIVVVTILMIVINIEVYSALRSADGFAGNIQASGATYIEYSIVAKKDTATQLDTAGTVGIITSDPLYAKEKVALGDQTSAVQQDYSDLTNLANSVESDQVELASMRTASLAILKDNYSQVYNHLVVLGTFRIKQDPSTNTSADVSKPFVLYVSGIDTYGDVVEVSRSDVNMLIVVNPTSHTILLVNTPRDYYVQLHGTAGIRDKLTHAGIYGIDMSRQTLEDLYGVKIPYYMRINFTSLVKIIDTTGPINVYSDYAFKSYKAGYNTLDSKRALEFARERHSFEDGDRQRGRDQQHVIEAIINKMTKPQNTIHVSQEINVLQDAIETNMGESDIKQLIRTQLNDMGRWSISSISVDGSGSQQPTYSMGSQPLYVMMPNQTSLDIAKARIADALVVQRTR